MIFRIFCFLIELWINKMNSKFKFNKKYFRIGVCYILSNIYLILGVIKCICKVMLYWWCFVYI